MAINELPPAAQLYRFRVTNMLQLNFQNFHDAHTPSGLFGAMKNQMLNSKTFFMTVATLLGCYCYRLMLLSVVLHVRSGRWPELFSVVLCMTAVHNAHVWAVFTIDCWFRCTPDQRLCTNSNKLLNNVHILEAWNWCWMTIFSTSYCL